MYEQIYFFLFLGIALAFLAVAAWMYWFTGHAIKGHRNQVEDMLREMREEIDKAGKKPPE
jgi:hypothetical protein